MILRTDLTFVLWSKPVKNSFTMMNLGESQPYEYLRKNIPGKEIMTEAGLDC